MTRSKAWRRSARRLAALLALSVASPGAAGAEAAAAPTIARLAPAPVPVDPVETALDVEAVLARVPGRSMRTLQEEKVLLLDTEEGSDSVQGLVLFAQPRARAFQLLAQSERQSEFRPELRRIETVSRFEGGTLDEHRLRIMFLDIGYRLRNLVDYRQSWMRWELDPDYDNDLEVVSGSWRIYELDDRSSLGLFETVVRVGGALPGFLQRQVTRKNVPVTLSRCRHWVDSGGRWRP